MYTKTELRIIQRHFSHPQTEKMFVFLKCAVTDSVSSEVYSNLRKTQVTFEVCQREADAPHQFWVSLPNISCVSNRVVSLDSMSMDQRTVLHAVNNDNNFSAARFLEKFSTVATREALVSI